MTDYTKTGNPISGARGISKNVRDEFALIETAVNSKANIASPTFTGTPRAPTPAAGTSGTVIPTTDFCNNLTFISSLPGQTGNAGKFIKTDGSTATWQMAIPLQTGHAGKVLVTDGTSESWSYPQLRRSARTSNTILSTDDHAHFIDITSGTFTQTFDACATLATGWWCIISNSGTGDITLDPNGTETIGGQTTRLMYPGEKLLIQCDGSNLNLIILSAFVKTFTGSGTFTKPAGYNFFSGFVWGAGGSGEKSGGANEADGGGGGGCTLFNLPSSLFSTTETVTIAAASTGSATAGGNSTLGSLVTGYGGAGGGGGVLSAGTATTGGQPDTESSTGVNYLGGGDLDTATSGSSYYGGGGGGGAFGAGASVGGNSVFGGAGGGGITNAGAVKAGGTSKYGGNGGASADASSGVDGSAPGGGGGATRTGTKSGDGARGQVTIYGVI